MAIVRFPGKLVDPSAEDLAAPLQQLLRDLGLLESSDDAAKGAKLIDGTPPSLQVIKAGTLSVTKAWVTLTASAGFAGALTTLIAAWKAAPDNLQITLVAGASVIIAATAIAIAMIVRGDVGARAATSTELYRSRAQVSNSFLAAALAAAGETSTQGGRAAAGSDTLANVLAAIQIDVPNQDPSPGIYGLRRRAGDNSWQIRRGDGDWVSFSPPMMFEVELPLPSPAA